MSYPSIPKENNTSRSYQSVVPLLLMLIGYALYLFRFGYGYGNSDQDEFLPYLLHLLNTELFQNDWFVQRQTEAFSVRTWFVYLLRTLSFMMPAWMSVLTVYLASFASISIAIYKLADLLTHNRLASVVTSFAVCILTPFWTLGGNDLVHSMLVPSMTAWAIGLWGFVFYLRQLHVAAALMAGVATLFQALVGLQVMALLTGLMLFRLIDSKTEIEMLVKAGIAYAISAAPALIPLFYQQFSYTPPLLSSDPSAFYIMAEFRNPHHYLFNSFDKVRLVQFFILLLAGYFALLYLQKKERLVHADFFNRIIGIVAVCCIVGYLGTEFKPVMSIAKIQLFKMTIVVKVLMVMLVIQALITLFPSRVSDFLDRLVFEKPLQLAGLALAGIVILLLLQPHRMESKVYPWSTTESAEHQIAAWAQANTETGEVFAVPPSWSSFRSHAERAIVINHKAFPHRNEDMPVWYNRLLDMAPIKPPARTDNTLQKNLDLRYHALGPQQLELLSYEYTFDYVVRNASLPAGSAFSVVFETQGWFIYKVSPQRLTLHE